MGNRGDNTIFKGGKGVTLSDTKKKGHKVVWVLNRSTAWRWQSRCLCEKRPLGRELKFKHGKKGKNIDWRGSKENEKKENIQKF